MKTVTLFESKKILGEMVKLLIGISLVALSLVGCTTVPVHENLPSQDPGINLNTEKAKFPYDVAIVLPDSFSDFVLKSTLKNMNMTYDFQYDIGNDFTETLPEFLRKRFNDVTVVKSLDNAEKFDFVFIPSISKSRISTRINTTITQEPVYAIEIDLGVVVNKKGKEYSTTTIKEGIERVTEVACWACFGEKILNQQKIKDEYLSVLTSIYAKLDSYLTKIIR